MDASVYVGVVTSKVLDAFVSVQPKQNLIFNEMKKVTNKRKVGVTETNLLEGIAKWCSETKMRSKEETVGTTLSRLVTAYERVRQDVLCGHVLGENQ